jgi:hypothetical protein
VDKYGWGTFFFARSFDVERLSANVLDASLSFIRLRHRLRSKSCHGRVLCVSRPNAIGQAAKSRYRDDDFIAGFEVDWRTMADANSGGLE